MKISDLARYAFTICGAVAMLVACGGGVQSVFAPSAPIQSKSPLTHAIGASYKLLFSFDGRNGWNPHTGLTEVNGILYGTTLAGGHGCPRSGGECGTVFSLTVGGKERVLHSFVGSTGGNQPSGGLTFLKGRLYGTTEIGGQSGGYCGVVFSLTTSGAEKVLHSFGEGTDGCQPEAALMRVSGTLYSTTYFGGAYNSGTVYSIGTSGTEKLLHSFGNDSDGTDPLGSLLDVNGTLYSTTQAGGTGCAGTGGCGTIFSISTRGLEKVLYSFVDGSDGAYPDAGLVNVKGTFYGTTLGGGRSGSGCLADEGCGTVYSISRSGGENVLHRFGKGKDGSNPLTSLTVLNGTLYGTTYTGGAYGSGTVFSISTSGKEKVLHSFGGSGDGIQPVAGLIDVNGTLYGTTSLGGSDGGGTVFALTP